MVYQFAALAHVTYVGLQTKITAPDIASSTYLQASSNGTLDDKDYNSTWLDPTGDIISMAHELTLRAAIATSNTLVVISSDPASRTKPWSLTRCQVEIGWPNLTHVNRTISQEAEVRMAFEENVYQTKPDWLAGAFTLMALACLSIAPTYWGWWRLGRPVSMSPLEIAKAFDAPLMQHADPNGTADDHLKIVGGMRVRYGSYATVTGQLESDAIDRLSCRPDFNNALIASAGEQGSSDGVGPNQPSSENVSASNTPIFGPSRPDDEIELQMLHPEASPASRMLSLHGPTRRSLVSSDPSESITETPMDSPRGQVPGAGPSSSRIHTRIEMRLKFAEE